MGHKAPENFCISIIPQKILEARGEGYEKPFGDGFVGAPCSRGTFHTPFCLKLLRKSAPTRESPRESHSPQGLP